MRPEKKERIGGISSPRRDEMKAEHRCSAFIVVPS
jgi:hypothetical protein